MSPLTVPEVQRRLLAAQDPPQEHRFHQWWSSFRRQHQASARRCHAHRRAHIQPTPLTGVGMVPLSSVTRELDDALWEQIAALLPAPRRRGGKPPLAYRTMLEGILWTARTGAPWRDLPDCFGSWKSVHDTYYRWQQLGYWPRVLAALQSTATASD